MTWVPIPNAVRKLREIAKLEQRELAKKSGLTERAIRLLESKRAPKTMYAATVKALVAAERVAHGGPEFSPHLSSLFARVLAMLGSDP